MPASGSPTSPSIIHHPIRMKPPRLRLLVVSLALAAIASADSFDTAAEALTRGVEAYRAGDHAAFLEEMEHANRLRPDHPTYRYYLAAAHALSGNAVAAADTLGELAAWGLHLPAEEQEDFDGVRDSEDVQDAFAALRGNLQPQGRLSLMTQFPADGGLFEGIAFDPRHGTLFLSDLHHARILRVGRDGTITVFATSPDPGFGPGGLALDPDRQRLWAAAPAMPEVAGYTEAMAGQSQLLAFDLSDGSLAARIGIPADGNEKHSVVDLTIAPDGTLYAPDSASPVVWRVGPDAVVAELFARIERPGPRHSLQGAALSPDGNWLLVSDYSTGLHRIRLSDRRIEFLNTPLPGIGTALGIDGIAIRDDILLAVQNGVSPARLLAVRLTPDGRPVEVNLLASGQPELADPTLVTATPEGFLAVGLAGWRYFGAAAVAEPAARRVSIVRIDRGEIPWHRAPR